MVEKRHSERQDSMIVIEFRKAGSSDEYYAGITHDCSDDGFSFETEAPGIHSGAILEFKLKYPDKEKFVIFSGDVAWTTKQNYGIIAGVKLHSESSEKQNILSEIISLSPALSKNSSERSFDSTKVTPYKDQDSTKNKNYSDKISESIMSAVKKNRNEVTNIKVDRKISETVPPAVIHKKPDMNSDTRDKSNVLSQIIIALTIIAASVMSVYFLLNSSKSTIPHEVQSSIKKEAVYEIPSPPENHDIPEIKSEQPEEQVVAVKEPEKEILPVSDPQEKIPEFNPPLSAFAENHNKEPDIVKSTTDNRFVIHVSAWETLEYANSMNKRVITSYPNAIMVLENNFHIIIIPDILSRKSAETIAEDLGNRLNVTPIIYAQKREF